MRALLLLPLALAGCDTLPDATPSDVLTMGCTTENGSCDDVGIADGTTPVTLAVCVPSAVTDRPTNLEATLQLSSGNQWVDTATPGTLVLPFSSQRCQYPAFTPGTSVGVVEIDATVGTVVVTQHVPLRAARITIVEIAAATDTDTLDTGDALTVTLRAENDGQPTVGTTLVPTVTTVPTGGTVLVSPSSTVYTTSATPLTFNVSPTTAVTSFTVGVTATPPPDTHGNAAASQTGSITIDVPQ
jgi:hypothetical protein